MKIVKILSVVIFMLLALNIYVANHAVDESIVVADLTTEIQELTKENLLLRQNVAKASSLTLLESKIRESGFIDAKNVAYISTSNIASR